MANNFGIERSRSTSVQTQPNWKGENANLGQILRLWYRSVWAWSKFGPSPAQNPVLIVSGHHPVIPVSINDKRKMLRDLSIAPGKKFLGLTGAGLVANYSTILNISY